MYILSGTRTRSHRFLFEVFSEHPLHRFFCCSFLFWKKRWENVFFIWESDEKMFSSFDKAINKFRHIYIYIYTYVSLSLYIYIYIYSFRNSMNKSFIIPRIIPLPKDFFTIPIRQRILYRSSLKGFLYYSSLKGFFTAPLSKHFFTIPLSRTFLLFQSDRGFFTAPLSKDFFTVPVRQRILYCSSLKGFLYFSIPTEDSFLIWENDKTTFSSFEKTIKHVSFLFVYLFT